MHTMSTQSLSEADTYGADTDGGTDMAPELSSVHVGAQPHTGRWSSSQLMSRPGERGQLSRGSATPLRPAEVVDRIGAAGRSQAFLAPARLEAFVAVAEEGTFTAAARRLDISQPAVSQAITALERQLDLQLLVRSNTGVQATRAGATLLAEARAILVRHNRMVRTVTAAAADSTGVIRLGIPGELASGLLRVVARLAVDHPDTRVVPSHLPMAAQLVKLRHGDLDVSLMREIPAGNEFDNMLVAEEKLGVLLARDLAARLTANDGIQLNALARLRWIDFPRSGSPAWYDELAASLRSHGIDTGEPTDCENFLIPSVRFTALSAGQAFAIASEEWAHMIPETVEWCPLAGHPLVRRTWAVWPTESRNRDVAHLIAAF